MSKKTNKSRKLAKGCVKKSEKAYKNLDFLNSPEARPVRILSEFLEPATRFKKYRIQDTIVFLGSARIQGRDDTERKLKEIEKELKEKKRHSGRDRSRLKAAKTAHRMSRYYEDARCLANLLTGWSLSLGRGKKRFLVCSGGGPGIMEAANKGATDNPKGYTVGLNISLPFEQAPNPNITQDLSFEFHYFFIRKYWFLYLAKALVVFPGGFGTLDELFEFMTLIQTKKVEKKIPVLIYGTSFWKKLVDFDFMAEEGTISKEDLELFHFSDDPEDAFAFLKDSISEIYLK